MKFRILPLIALTIGLASCGESNDSYNDYDSEEDYNAVDTIKPFRDSLTYGVTGITTPDAHDPEVLSNIFGSLLANQFKKQGLIFLDPDQFVEDFKKYRTKEDTVIPMDQISQRLSALADSTGRFKHMNGEQKTEGRYLFPQLFYSDFGSSPLFPKLILETFEQSFLKSWKENLAASEAEIAAFEVISKEMQAVMNAEKEKMNAAKFRQVKIDGENFLKNNAVKSGVKTTTSGLQYKIIKKGSGTKPIATNKVLAHYEGTLIDGTKFDSSFDRGEPAEFPLNRVIPGWTEGLQLMSPGATYEFYIPYGLGYGSRGSLPKIPPYSTLIFKVELKSFK